MGGPAKAKPDNIHKDAPTMEPTAEELVSAMVAAQLQEPPPVNGRVRQHHVCGLSYTYICIHTSQIGSHTTARGRHNQHTRAVQNNQFATYAHTYIYMRPGAT